MQKLLPSQSPDADYQSLRETEGAVQEQSRYGMCIEGGVLGPTTRDLMPRWPNFTVDKGAVQFGLRMSVLLTIGSLFVLVGSPSKGTQYPQGTWVLITILFVSWFPRLDAASVVEKGMQRLVGTLVGAAIGLICGFSSMAMPGERPQALFLGFCVMVVTFLVVFASSSFNIGQTKIMQRYSYATILCLLTFSIAVLPFYSGTHPKWKKGVWRIVNVMVGCIISALGSVFVLPRSTSSILREKIGMQVKLAGESSQAVLYAAADAFSGNLNPLALADELLETPAHRRTRHRMSIIRQSHRNVNKSVIKEDGDVVLAKFGSAIKDWRATKALFPVVPYDPFNIGVREEAMKRFHLKTARILAQALRIQTMVVVLDGIIRNDSGYDFDDDQIDLFASVGSLIQKMLTVPLHEVNGNSAASELTLKLTETRNYIVQVSSTVSNHDSGEATTVQKDGNNMYSNVFESILLRLSGDKDDDEDADCKYQTRLFPCTVSCVLLFLQLVEQLILRSLWLYHTWREAEKHIMKEIFPHGA